MKSEESADRIVELVKAEFPHAKLFVRAFDRGHALRLINAGVDYQLRETLESAFVFGRRVMVDLGVDEAEADEILLDVRRRDEQRLEMQIAGGLGRASRSCAATSQRRNPRRWSRHARRARLSTRKRLRQSRVGNSPLGRRGRLDVRDAAVTSLRALVFAPTCSREEHDDETARFRGAGRPSGWCVLAKDR